MNSFLDKIKDYITQNNLLPIQENEAPPDIIVAVSGGVDSMVLAQCLIDLSNDLGVIVSIAHCNFQLRGEESDADTALVLSYFKAQNITVHTQFFDTQDYATTHQLSIQMAARELRYAWFESLADANKNIITCIALGHHLNDSVETILYNLIKGKENQIIKSIAPQRGIYIRPLLWATKEQIYEYAKQKNIPFREDASNADNDYQRNLIRNEIIPLMRQIHPRIENQLIERAQTYHYQYEALLETILPLIPTFFAQKDDWFYIDVANYLAISQQLQIICWKYVCMDCMGLDYHFTIELQKLLISQTGKKLSTQDWIAYRDRKYIVIGLKSNLPDDSTHTPITISDFPAQFDFGRYTFEIQVFQELNQIDIAKKWHFIGSLKDITLPLYIRTWQEGDKCRNRNGFIKKVKDTLAAELYPAHLKKWAFVIATSEKIIYVENANLFVEPSQSIDSNGYPCIGIRFWSKK